MLPFEKLCGPELTSAGFGAGRLTDRNADHGRWYIRTHRTHNTEVEVDQENGNVTVSRLTDRNADWIAHSVTFPHEVPPALIAAYAAMVDRYDEARHSHPAATITAAELAGLSRKAA
ncbi:hypothetical protein SAMN05421505_120118 [Sinosporangium album]|uniref:Uncharacterized protein n=1 Tax=Sinosporangium album TaxID=504805 RepID=A0A1G8EIQ2_9ACTN|nr:hypothetical protein [Sinosporangium album]SDH69757.1 hypothetical protein SAMN05421505_120118 [Sinosporangium album]